MTPDTRKLMGAQIRQARQDIHMTQETLATCLNKTQKAISAYESGTIAVRTTDLPTLAKTLHKPIVYFFGDNYACEQVQAIYEQLSPVFQHLWLEQGNAYLKLHNTHCETAEETIQHTPQSQP